MFSVNHVGLISPCRCCTGGFNQDINMLPTNHHRLRENLDVLDWELLAEQFESLNLDGKGQRKCYLEMACSGARSSRAQVISFLAKISCLHSLAIFMR